MAVFTVPPQEGSLPKAHKTTITAVVLPLFNILHLNHGSGRGAGMGTEMAAGGLQVYVLRVFDMVLSDRDFIRTPGGDEVLTPLFHHTHVIVVLISRQVGTWSRFYRWLSQRSDRGVQCSDASVTSE